MKTLELNEDLQALTNEELMIIDGGESVAYYIGYAGGQVAAFWHGFANGLFDL